MKAQNPTTLIAAIALAGSLAAIRPAEATITFTGGVADWTFYYDDDAEAFDVVLRQKPNTVATGLDDPYAGPPGGVGGSPGNDFNFSTLQVNVTAAPLVDVNGIGYLVTPASGTGYSDASQPDLGIRMRLREDDGVGGFIDQFDSFQMVLNWGSSTKPTGAEFVLFRTDINGDPTVINFETAAGDLTHDWPVWGHSHWHFGFSEPGDYELVFDVQGIGGKDGPTPVNTARVNFNVVPEPSTALLSLIAAGALLGRRRR